MWQDGHIRSMVLRFVATAWPWRSMPAEDGLHSLIHRRPCSSGSSWSDQHLMDVHYEREIANVPDGICSSSHSGFWVLAQPWFLSISWFVNISLHLPSRKLNRCSHMIGGDICGLDERSGRAKSQEYIYSSNHRAAYRCPSNNSYTQSRCAHGRAIDEAKDYVHTQTKILTAQIKPQDQSACRNGRLQKEDRTREESHVNVKLTAYCQG